MINRIAEIAQLAGKKILYWYERSDIPVKAKEDHSPLTQADEDANAIIIKSLSEDYEYPILTEESLIDFEIRKDWSLFWLVDPLDGTKNFMAKDGQFTVNIALIKDGAPILGVVLAPALNLCYTAELNKGAFLNGKKIYNNSSRTDLIAATSSKHGSDETTSYLQALNITQIKPFGSSLKLCKLADGEIDIYPRLGTTCEWDIAAGQIIATEGGAKIFDVTTKNAPLYNKPDLRNNHFVAIRGNLTPELFFSNLPK